MIVHDSLKNIKKLKNNIEKIITKKETSFAKLTPVVLEEKIESYTSLRKIYVENLFSFAKNNEKKVNLRDYFHTWKLFNKFIFNLKTIYSNKNTNTTIVKNVANHTK